MSGAKVCKTFILLALLLCFVSAAAESYAALDLDRQETYAMNLFLSNFTETGVATVDSFTDHDALAHFAIYHLWFNDHDSIERGEYGDVYNRRVSEARLLEVMKDFFYYAAESADYLNPGNIPSDGEYFYFLETGGENNCGFARSMGVHPIGDDRYFVSFMVFDNGTFWENDVLDDDLDEIIERYDSPVGFGSALIYAEDLSDRSSYKMISYAPV